MARTSRKVAGNQMAKHGSETGGSSYSVSMRHAFIPFKGKLESIYIHETCLYTIQR